MKPGRIGIFVWCALVAISMNAGNSKAVVIDHTCTDLGAVPANWINQAKSMFRVWYGHTSHGSQITTGMENLQSHYGDPYTFNPSGAGGALSYQEVEGDLGYDGDLWWEEQTRAQLDLPDNDRNVVMWSWCGGVSENTPEGIAIYLNAMNQLESDYPQVRFIYMTGHLDGTGEHGNLHIRNNQIRSFCIANDKILFDFADIESYDPDGDYFLDRGANDECYYDDGNWAEEWCAEHPGSDLCWSCDCAHSHPLNCNLKGRAFWWMAAVMAGWNAPNPTPTPHGSPTPTQCPWTPTPNPDCWQTGVTMVMPADFFWPGDLCNCESYVCNAEGYDLYDSHLCIVLDVHGGYFFGPGFGMEFDTYYDELPVIRQGRTYIEIISSFNWPGGAGWADNVIWYGGILNADMASVLGEIGSFSFGWGE